MRRLLRGTRGRLALTATAVLALALLASDAALLVSLAYSQRQDVDAALASRADVLAASIEQAGGAITFGGDQPALETASGVTVDVAVVDGGTTPLQSPAQPLARATLDALAQGARRAGGAIYSDVVDMHGVTRRAMARPLDGTGGAPVLVVSRSTAELNGTLARTAALLGAASLGLLVAGGALQLWLAGRALRPVREIAALARSLGGGDLHRRVDIAVPDDELGELVDTFNEMIARLEATFESLRRFTADASHELRAPLALLRTELDVALSRERGAAEYRATLVLIHDHVERLTRLADQLLVLARADGGALMPERESIDVADVLEEIAAHWQAAAAAKDVRIEVASPDGGTVRADPSLLRRVIDNLVDNALRYAPERSAVTLAGEGTAAGWWLSVRDQGPGVPAAHRPLLFTRFARSDAARSRDGGAAGLGLALCAAIVAAHGGRIEYAAPAEGRGAAFRFFLPS